MLALALGGIVVILWVWCRRYKNNDEPPIGSGSKMLIGHTLNYVGDSAKLWDSIKMFSREALQRGGVIKTTVGPKVLYVLSDPEDFTTLANVCLQKDPTYDFARPWLGDGLVTSPPTIWKNHRKLLNPAFNQYVLDSFMDVFNSQSRILVNNLKVEVGKGPFDHWAYTKSIALETICLTALGANFGEKKVSNIDFFEAIENLFDIFITRFQKFWMHSNLLFSLTSLKGKQKQYIEVLHKMSNTILKQRKENFINTHNNVKNVNEYTKGHRYESFMDLILKIARDTNVFTDREIREHVDTIIITGHDTTATALMFCLLLVGSHPRVQEKIQEELKNIFGDDDRDVTKQDLSQMIYLEAVIKEALRIHPIVPVIGRKMHKDIKLGNCTLSKGKSVILSIYGVYRHPMWGPDVDEFRPERWFDSSAASFGSYGTSSFGIGRRTCIGKTYAMMSMKVTLAHVFRNYIIHGDDTNLKLKLDVMLRPVSGYFITIKNRN